MSSPALSRNSTFGGNDIAALWCMGEVSDSSVSIHNCTFLGKIWSTFLLLDSTLNPKPETQNLDLTPRNQNPKLYIPKAKAQTLLPKLHPQTRNSGF